MDRIEKALKRAKKKEKEERDKSFGSFGRGRPMNGNHAHILAEKPDYADSSDADKKSRYKITLNPEILEKNKIVAHNKLDERCIAYDQLRTHVLQTMSENGWRTLAVTSPTEGCGKTVTAINLAFAVARSADQTVMLVDFDLRRPNIAKYLGIKPRAGLSDLFQGRADIEDVMVQPTPTRLSILPNFEPISHTSEVLGSESTKKLIDKMRGRYSNRILIFDLPPLLTFDDVVAFLPTVDCTLLVTISGETLTSDIEASRQILGRHPLVGGVLNFGEHEKRKYY